MCFSSKLPLRRPTSPPSPFFLFPFFSSPCHPPNMAQNQVAIRACSGFGQTGPFRLNPIFLKLCEDVGFSRILIGTSIFSHVMAIFLRFFRISLLNATTFAWGICLDGPHGPLGMKVPNFSNPNYWAQSLPSMEFGLLLWAHPHVLWTSRRIIIIVMNWWWRHTFYEKIGKNRRNIDDISNIGGGRFFPDVFFNYLFLIYLSF